MPEPVTTTPANPVVTTAPVVAPVISAAPVIADRPLISAKKALGLTEKPSVTVKKEHDKLTSQQPKDKVSLTPPAPEVVAPVVAAPEPAAPAAKPAEVAPVVEAKKVKIGGKEYTEAELEAALAAKTTPATVAEPKPEAKPAAAPAPTKEEIATAETNWKKEFVKTSGLNFSLSTDEMDKILSGGEEAVQLFAAKQTELFANAVMHARKSMYSDLNKTLLPEINAMRQHMTPLVDQHVSIAQYQVEQAFCKAYPDLSGQVDTARQVAEAAIQQFPAEIGKLTQAQFIEYVAGQTQTVLDRSAKASGFGSHKEQQEAVKLWKEKNAAPVVGEVTSAAAQVAVVPAAKPVAQAPAANSPAAIPSTPGPSFAKSVSASMRG